MKSAYGTGAAAPPAAATYEPLDGVLRHDRSRIPALLDYVRYPHNPALQVTALRLAAHLAERLPDLVHLLPGKRVEKAGYLLWRGMGRSHSPPKAPSLAA